MEEHTPGPWWVSPQGYRVMWVGRNSIGEVSCSEVICDTANNAKTRTPENAANARLIARAPIMEDALDLIAGFPDLDSMFIWCEIHGISYDKQEPPYLTMAKIAGHATKWSPDLPDRQHTKAQGGDICRER